MFARKKPWLLGVVFLTGAIGFTRCRVNDTLDDQLWRCDVNAPENQCGEKDGKPMTCWQGYCMPSCDPDVEPGDGQLCLNVRVLLQTCTPSNDDCPGDLNCYRTDLLFDEGICVPFKVCDTDEDCEGFEQDTCASSVLAEFAGGGEAGAGSSGPSFDHLHCLQDECFDGQTDCGEGNRCLPKSYPGDNYPDICVPRCDSSERCPPNYACAKNSLSEGADKVCIPGVPGVRCTSDQDCALGSCLDTGAGFSVCSFTCENDEGCELFTSPPFFFRCLAPAPEAQKICVNSAVFQGFQCQSADDCPPETPLCTPYSPSVPDQGHSECRAECDEDGRCQPRGGLPHVCLAEGEGGCYPGSYGIPCNEDIECMTPYTCREVEPSERDFRVTPKICTLPCTTQSDCQPDPLNPKRLDRPSVGWCDGESCRLPGLPGKPCEEDHHCYVRCEEGRCVQ